MCSIHKCVLYNSLKIAMHILSRLKGERDALKAGALIVRAMKQLSVRFTKCTLLADCLIIKTSNKSHHKS